MPAATARSQNPGPTPLSYKRPGTGWQQFRFELYRVNGGLLAMHLYGDCAQRTPVTSVLQEMSSLVRTQLVPSEATATVGSSPMNSLQLMMRCTSASCWICLG